MAVGADGSIFIADSLGHRVRRVDPSGTIGTFAGTGDADFWGDGGPAVDARLNLPNQVAVATDGRVLIADLLNHRLRQVDRAGRITTIAGRESSVHCALGALAVSSEGIYIACGSYPKTVVMLIDPSGKATTVTGNATGNYTREDGKPAAETSLYSVSGIAVNSEGLYIAEDGGVGEYGQDSDRVWRVDGSGRMEIIVE